MGAKAIKLGSFDKQPADCQDQKCQYVLIRNQGDVIVDFEPSEYMRKIIFPSVTQAARKKRPEYSQQESNL